MIGLLGFSKARVIGACGFSKAHPIGACGFSKACGFPKAHAKKKPSQRPALVARSAARKGGAPLAYKPRPDPVIEALSADILATISKRRLDAEERERLVASARARAEEEAERAKVYQLAFWPDDERAMPGDFIACALFSASKRTQYVDGESLASVNGLTVIFTGKRLTQVHADVWMGIMHLARERYEGDVVRFRERTLLDLIGRYTHLHQRDQLKKWIRQLQATSVLIQDDAKQKRFGGSLLPWHEEDDGDGHTIFAVDISRDLAKILAGNFWKVNWELRKSLQRKPLALWLQTYFCRFKKPVTVAQLHALSGSSAQLKMFRHHLSRALDELHDAGGHSAVIDRATDVVSAYRRPPRPARPANDGRQTVLPFVRRGCDG